MRIVCDSSADFKTDKNGELFSVPLKIIAGTKEFTDDENIDVSEMTDYLYGYNGKSSTACPSVTDWLDGFGDAEEIFAIAITSTLSGSCNSARLAKEQYEKKNPQKKVCVIDSLSAGPELKLIAEKIRELSAKGLSFEDIEKEIKLYETDLLFSLESLKNLANNGRVGKVTAKLAGVLGIRVVGKASIRGDLEPLSKARGEAKALSEVIRFLKENRYNGGKIIIDHCDNLSCAEKLQSLIKEKYPDADVRIAPTFGLCSFYAEKGGLLIGFEKA